MRQRKAWKFKEYEITLDQVTGLGDFVEVEYKAHKAVDPKAVTSDMLNLLKKIDCGKIERSFRGYPFMLLYPQEAVFDLV